MNAFKKANRQSQKTANDQARALSDDDKPVLRVGGKWMKVVSARKGMEITDVIRPVEYFSRGSLFDLQAAARNWSLTPDFQSKFIQVAMTETGSELPVSYRSGNRYIDRGVAIADFDINLSKAGYDYHSAFIVFDSCEFWFDEVDIVEFPIWRGVLEVPRGTKVHNSPTAVGHFVKVSVGNLKSLEEIEAACVSLLSAPEPKILEQLEAPARFVPV